MDIHSHPLREFVHSAQYQSQELRDGIAGLDDGVERFFPWMDKLLEQVIENPSQALDKTRFKEAPFPLYANNDESRKLISDLSKPLVGLQRPNEAKLFAILDTIFAFEIEGDTKLDDNDKKFIPLIRHILMNQIQSGKFDMSLPTEMALVKTKFLDDIEIPDAIDMNKVILTDDETLKPHIDSFTDGLIKSEVLAILEDKGIEEVVKYIAANYSQHSIEYNEAIDVIAYEFDGKCGDIVDALIKLGKDDESFDLEMDVSGDIARLAEAEVKTLLKEGAAENKAFTPEQHEQIQESFGQELVYTDLLLLLKYDPRNREVLTQKISEVESEMPDMAELLKAVLS